jgi:histidine decarboxylase
MNKGNQNEGYLMGFVLGVGKVPQRLTPNLDSILAFDQAEVSTATLGQINMITVSSFCGPQGKIWGYDLAAHPELRSTRLFEKNFEVPVYSALPLLEAARSLFGTVDQPHFPLLPGSHVPCAEKSFTVKGPKRVYCALGIGVPQDRNRNACLLMEDVGSFPRTASKYAILKKVVKSILSVGIQQQVPYREIFVELREITVKSKEVGCALVAAPYFALAQQAIPTRSGRQLSKMSLPQWEKEVLKL